VIRTIAGNGLPVVPAASAATSTYHVAGELAGYPDGPNVPGPAVGDGGDAVDASLAYPYTASVTQDGDILIADCRNNRVRVVTTDGRIDSVAGNGLSGSAGDGGQPEQAHLYCPSTVVRLNHADLLLVSDSLNHRIRVVG
jgi:hypothetical protein